MLLSQYKPLAQKAYCAAIVLLLILSEVFSSNIQAALPTFSSLARLALTGGAVALLGVKIFLLTDYEARWQPILAALVLAYTAFATWYGDDVAVAGRGKLALLADELVGARGGLFGVAAAAAQQHGGQQQGQAGGTFHGRSSGAFTNLDKDIIPHIFCAEHP